MLIKSLILIGRTFIATFIVVNFFNIIPINYSSNAWFVQVSMLMVDTSSLLLLGLSSLKLASFLSINSEVDLEGEDHSQKQNKKYYKNIKVINKFSSYLVYFFMFIAILQIYVIPNGLSQLDILYSEKLVKLEKQYQLNQNKIESKSQINLENNENNENNENSEKSENSENYRVPNLFQKNIFFQAITKERNNAISYLVRDAIKVFLMSLIWAYGFFKLAKFS